MIQICIFIFLFFLWGGRGGGGGGLSPPRLNTKNWACGSGIAITSLLFHARTIIQRPCRLTYLMCPLIGTRFTISHWAKNEQWMNFAVISCNQFYLRLKIQYKYSTPCTPVRHRWGSCRSPDGHHSVNDRRSRGSLSPGGDRRDSRRWSPGVRTIPAGTLAGHQPKIWSFGAKIGLRRMLADSWVSLQNCSRSAKSAGELPIPKSANRPDIRQRSAELSSIGTPPLGHSLVIAYGHFNFPQGFVWVYMG